MKGKLIKKFIVTGLSLCSLMMLMPQGSMAAWKKDSTGYWYTEGNSWVVGWKCIDGLWYYFDSNGYMKTLSWIETNGKWYFVSDTGCMLKSTTVDGYTLGADGAWIKDASDNSNKAGWKQDNSGWWYLNENGSYATYWKSFDTDKVEPDYDGRYVEVKTWYYFGADGYMKTGWQMIDGNWYYFKASGEMATDENVDGYILGKDGAMIDDLFVKKSDGDFQIKILDKEHILSDKKLTFCIINNSGKPVTETWSPVNPGPYWVEKYVDGKWTRLHFKSPYDGYESIPQYINITDIKTVNVQTIDLNEFEGFNIYEYGKYRVSFQSVDEGNKNSDPVYAEFEVCTENGSV